MLLQFKNGTVIASGTLRKNNPVDLKSVGAKGTSCAAFGVCVKSEKSDDGWQNDWLDCKAWKELADRVATLPPSASVFVIGKMETREWQGRDGEMKSKTECVCDFVTTAYIPEDEPALPDFDSSPGELPKFAELDDGDGELPF